MTRSASRSVRVAAFASVIVCLAGLCTAPAGASDEVAAYLERLELRQLLAAHLERELANAGGDRADDLVVQLASLYTVLLQSIDDDDARVELEVRSRRLLDRAPPDRADALRLALLRGTYARIEKTAENHRLRRSTDDAVARALGLLDELLPQLTPLRIRLRDRVEELDRRIGRSSPETADILSNELDALVRLADQATFLEAWSQYYRAWLLDQRGPALDAVKLFGELLHPDASVPDPNEVSEDLRANEAFARAILGMALSQSMTDGAAAARVWLELLAVERTAPVVREQLDAWRTAVLMEHGDFAAALDILRQARRNGQVTGAAWLRLLAVHSLEARDDASARALAQLAMAELASNDELSTVLDLGSRYGAEALGERGFASRYVRGVLQYDAARTAHGDDRPTIKSELVEQYENAAQRFIASRSESDAGEYPNAVAASRSFEAWCRYFQGRYREARQLFEEASLARDDPNGELLWMAIVCLDKVTRQSDDPDLVARLQALIDRFLSEYPASSYTPRLVLRRTDTLRNPSLADVDTLLSIPPSSDVYLPARRRAAQLLFALFRSARIEQREDIGSQFLAVIQGLMLLTEQDVLRGDAEARDRYIGWSLQSLEVALADDMRRLGSARAVLETLRDFAGDQHLQLDAVADEIQYRQIRERLYSNALSEAGELADDIWRRSPGDRWAHLAAHAVFTSAYERWITPRDERARELAGRLVATHGTRALGTYADNDEALSSPGVLAMHAAVAEVLRAVFDDTGDSAIGDEADALLRRLLTVRPNNAQFIREMALLAEARGERETALDAWRRLLAGLPVNGERWFEARVRSLLLLEHLDAPRAREVMAQHRQLHPSYGPQPWGARLEALDERLATRAIDDMSKDDQTRGEKAGEVSP